MIQLSALPITTGATNMAEILWHGGAEAGEKSGFEALLAGQLGTAPGRSDPAFAAMPLGALPDSGKFLPPALPKTPIAPRPLPFAGVSEDPAAPEDQASEPIDQPVAQALVPATTALPAPASPAPTLPAPSPAIVPARAGASLPLVQTAAQPARRAPSRPQSAPGPKGGIALKPAPVPGAAPLPASGAQSVLNRTPAAPAPVPAAPVPAAPVSAAPVPAALAPAVQLSAASPVAPPAAQPAKLADAADRPGSALPEPGRYQLQPPPALKTAPMLRSDLPPAVPPAPIAPALAAAIAAPLVELAAPAIAPSPSLRVRPAAVSGPSGLPSPAAGKVAAGPAPGLEPLRAKLALAPEVRFEPVALPSAAAEAQPASTANAAPAIRPLDFAALVDRLVEARDAAGPQTVSLALTHTEFGKVSLRFLQDEGGLSVAMTSPDPDFAQAVSAAIPAEHAASGEQPHGAGNGPANRPEADRSETPGQSRSGANPERRDERSPPRPDPAQAHRRTADQAGRNDIFA